MTTPVNIPTFEARKNIIERYNNSIFFNLLFDIFLPFTLTSIIKHSYPYFLNNLNFNSEYLLEISQSSLHFNFPAIKLKSC